MKSLPSIHGVPPTALWIGGGIVLVFVLWKVLAFQLKLVLRVLKWEREAALPAIAGAAVGAALAED